MLILEVYDSTYQRTEIEENGERSGGKWHKELELLLSSYVSWTLSFDTIIAQAHCNQLTATVTITVLVTVIVPGEQLAFSEVCGIRPLSVDWEEQESLQIFRLGSVHVYFLDGYPHSNTRQIV